VLTLSARHISGLWFASRPCPLSSPIYLSVSKPTTLHKLLFTLLSRLYIGFPCTTSFQNTSFSGYYKYYIYIKISSQQSNEPYLQTFNSFSLGGGVLPQNNGSK
jgi:hypothetical protein